MAKQAKVFCAVCGAECIPTEYVSGYGEAGEKTLIGKPGDKLCFACCAEGDRRTMDQDGRITLYLTLQGEPGSVWGSGKVSNWPGTLSFPCKGKRGHHNIAGARYDVWFNDHQGNPWHGTQYGNNTQLCHCRKLTRKGK